MGQTGDNSSSSPSRAFYLTVATILTQVGCLTIVIIFIALFGGIWLDGYFDTKPWFTMILTIASLPITILVMLKLVRAGTSKLNSSPPKNDEDTPQEEAEVGRN